MKHTILTKLNKHLNDWSYDMDILPPENESTRKQMEDSLKKADESLVPIGQLKTGHPEPQPEAAIVTYDVVDSGRPDDVIKKKHDMAKVLQHIVNSRKEGLEVNGKRILVYEEWLMITKMHQCTPVLEKCEYTAQKYGSVSFEATVAIVHMPTGKVIARAEGMSEQTEKGKGWMSLNQLKSLAQTRAGSKAMRVVFADIAVLAGYSPKPLEEIDETSLVKQSAPPKLSGLSVS